MDEDQKTLLKEAFGESSDSEGYEPEGEIEDSVFGHGSDATFAQNPTWEPIEEIKGLWLCRDFLSPQQQSVLLSAVHNEGWFIEASKNQAMKFGDLPSWAIELAHSILEVVLFGDHNNELNGTCLLPSDMLWREPLFDQLIVNVYQPGEGICAHVDLMRFEDGIAIVSLESSCVMHFTQDREGEKDQPMRRIPVYLTPGSLVILSGEARYLWKHEINRKPGFQMWEGQELHQKRRTSITLRKLCRAE